MDRFDGVIKKYYGNYQGFPSVVDEMRDVGRQMLAEKDVEIARLRKIEDAALRVSRGQAIGAFDDDETALQNLCDVIHANPRPAAAEKKE